MAFIAARGSASSKSSSVCSPVGPVAPRKLGRLARPGDAQRLVAQVAQFVRAVEAPDQFAPARVAQRPAVEQQQAGGIVIALDDRLDLIVELVHGPLEPQLPCETGRVLTIGEPTGRWIQCSRPTARRARHPISGQASRPTSRGTV
ncbi:hypothetical protein ACWDD9_31175 [Kitasatospora sp. NPDC001119]